MTEDRLRQIEENQAEIKTMLQTLLSVVAVQQKDLCEAIDVPPQTVRAKVLRGEVEVLQKDGSRLNYFTLDSAPNLKKRSVPK